MLAYEKHVAGASCFSKPFYFIGERAQTTENFFRLWLEETQPTIIKHY